jgi:hypothetical protein
MIYVGRMWNSTIVAIRIMILRRETRGIEIVDRDHRSKKISSVIRCNAQYTVFYILPVIVL